MKHFLKQSIRTLKKNAPTILTFVASAGVILTAVSVGKAVPKAKTLLEEEKEKMGDLDILDKALIAGPVFVPSVLYGVATISCIFGVNKLNKKQQASLVSAYSLLHNSYNNYKLKVQELYGENANKEVIESIANDRYKDSEIQNEVKDDEQIFYDEYSGRYFVSTILDVRNAEYHFNRNFALRGYASVNEFYEFLAIDPIEGGDKVGWNQFNDDGYAWIDFFHDETTLDDGLECVAIIMPFGPYCGYDE